MVTADAALPRGNEPGLPHRIVGSLFGKVVELVA
jgi:hypothetical protein